VVPRALIPGDLDRQ